MLARLQWAVTKRIDIAVRSKVSVKLRGSWQVSLFHQLRERQFLTVRLLFVLCRIAVEAAKRSQKK